jgi:hypothetical protein
MIIDPFPSFYCVVVVKIDFWRLWVVGSGRVKASTVVLLFNATTFTEFSPQLVKNNQNTLQSVHSKRNNFFFFFCTTLYMTKTIN